MAQQLFYNLGVAQVPPGPLPQTDPVVQYMHEGYIDPTHGPIEEEWSVSNKHYSLSEICGYKYETPRRILDDSSDSDS